MTTATNGTRTPVCDNPACADDRPETLYVHLNNGQVKTISDVETVTVTDAEIVFQRHELKPVTYPRSDVYFTCCQREQAPPQF